MKMNKFAKLPLYLGLTVFVFTVLFSAARLSGGGSVINQQSKATVNGAVLTARYSPTGIISLTVNSNTPIAGVDAVFKYEKNKIGILPSSLAGSPEFTTTGGEVDEGQSTFSFTALANQGSSVSSGIVATFGVKATGLQSGAVLQFVPGKSSVIEKGSGRNILVSTTDPVIISR